MVLQRAAKALTTKGTKEGKAADQPFIMSFALRRLIETNDA